MPVNLAAVINQQRCDSKPACPVSRSCPTHAVRFESGRVSVDAEKCLGCGICASVCPRAAVDLVPRI